MWADLACKVERHFHLIEYFLQVRRRQTGDNDAALVADDVRPVSRNNAIQATAALGIAEIGMREKRRAHVLITRAVADRAITGPSEWQEIPIAIRATAVFAVSERDTSTPWQFGQWPDFAPKIRIFVQSPLIAREWCECL